MEKPPISKQGPEQKWGEYVEDPGKIYYHGSSGDFELDPDKTDPKFGGELYVTDHVDRAQKFATGNTGKLHEVNLRLKKVFEFDKPISLDDANAVLRIAGLPEIQEWEWSPNHTMGNLHGKLSMGIAEQLKAEGNKDFTSDVINGKVNDILREAGYDAVRSPQASLGENVWRVLRKEAFVQRK